MNGIKKKKKKNKIIDFKIMAKAKNSFLLFLTVYP